MDDTKPTEKDNKILNALFDPESIKESVVFNASLSILQIIGIFAFSFLGATVQFGFSNWFAVLSSTTYWINFVMMTGEQFYAYNIAYQFAISVLMNSGKYKEALQKSDDLINGVFDIDSNKWLIKPLSDDSAYIDIAIAEMNESERMRLFKKKITTKINSINKVITKIELKNKPRLFSKWRINKWNRKIDRMKRTIEYLTAKMDDKAYYNSLDDKHIQGYIPIEQAAINSNQNDKPDTINESKWSMRDRKELERKGAIKRAVSRILTALLLPLVAWGAVSLKSGAIVSLIVMLLLQFVSGWRQAIKNFKKTDAFNAEQRFLTIKEIQRRLPAIKEREAAQAKLKAEIEKAEIQAWEDNKKFDAELLAKKKAEIKDLRTDRPTVMNLTLLPMN